MNEQIYLNVIAMFNSYKLLAKAYHWSEVTSMNKHQQLDNLYNLIVEFQDNFVEEGSVLYGLPDVLSLQSCNNISIDSAATLFNYIDNFTTQLKFGLKEASESVPVAGLESLVDNFIHEFNIIQYRYQMN